MRKTKLLIALVALLLVGCAPLRNGARRYAETPLRDRTDPYQRPYENERTPQR